MSKDPAFLFYFRDFLVSTELMTPEEVGLYIRILCHMADKGRLTIEHMQSICKAYGIAHVLHSRFKIDENGLYYNLRLEQEVVKRCNYTKSRRENAKHMHKHMGNRDANANLIPTKASKTVFKKLPTADTTIVQSFFYAQYELTQGCKALPEWGKDGKIFKEMLKVFTVDQIKDLIILFFSIENDFILKAGYSVGVFKSQIPKLQTGKEAQKARLERMMSQ